MATVEETVFILLFAILFSFISVQIQKRWGNRARIKEIQKTVKDYQKELREATKNKDEARVKELSKKEGEILALSQEMLFLPWKSMIIILPVWYVLSTVILPAILPHFMVTLGFSVPKGFGNILAGEVFKWGDYLGARGLFVYFTVISGMVMELVTTKLEEKAKA